MRQHNQDLQPVPYTSGEHYTMAKGKFPSFLTDLVNEEVKAMDAINFVRV
jgi:hypothetical protein